MKPLLPFLPVLTLKHAAAVALVTSALVLLACLTAGCTSKSVVRPPQPPLSIVLPSNYEPTTPYYPAPCGRSAAERRTRDTNEAIDNLTKIVKENALLPKRN